MNDLGRDKCWNSFKVVQIGDVSKKLQQPDAMYEQFDRLIMYTMIKTRTNID